jgi:hypothetical protein
MKLKATWVTVFALGAVFAAYASGQQPASSSSSTQAKIEALQELRDSGVLSEQEYEAKVNALQGGSSGPSASTAPFVWPGVRSVEADDSTFQMVAFTLAAPSDWKFAGEMSVSAAGTCHQGGRQLKFTMQSPDGLYRIAMLPGVQWTAQVTGMPRNARSVGCPPIPIFSAADFIANILLPQMQPGARIISVQGPGPALRETMSKRYEMDTSTDQMMAQRTGNPVGHITLDGAEMRIQYQVDGRPVEEMIYAVVGCNSKPFAMGGFFRSCGVADDIILVRAPLGQLDGFLAMREFDALLKSIQANPDWVERRKQENQQNIDQAANNINRGNAFSQQLIAQGNAQAAARNAAAAQTYAVINRGAQQFNQNLIASGQRAIAQDQEHQARMDQEAHQYALYAGDKQENINPYNGQTVVTSNRYAQQWVSSDGQYTVGAQNGVNPNDYVGPGGPTFAPMTPKN